MQDVNRDNIAREHAEWRDEHEAWLAEIGRWQTDHQEAMFAFERFEVMLRAHSGFVRVHAEAVDEHEKVLEARGGLDGHREFAANHFEQRKMHIRIKSRHRKMMAQLRLLLDAILEPH